MSFVIALSDSNPCFTQHFHLSLIPEQMPCQTSETHQALLWLSLKITSMVYHFICFEYLSLSFVLIPCNCFSLSPTSNGLCPSRFGCQGAQRSQCQGILQQYQEQIDEDVDLIEEEPDSHDPQILRHVVLLILLLCSMFVVGIFNSDKVNMPLWFF